MSAPILLVQIPAEEGEQAPETNGTVTENELIAIAIYKKDGLLPPSVLTQRVLDSETPFRFPSDVNEGATKTRVVYRYNLAQWHELLEITSLPNTAESLKQIMIPMLLYLKKLYPDTFNDIEYDQDFSLDDYAEVIPMK